jgi:hypothetical protein
MCFIYTRDQREADRGETHMRNNLQIQNSATLYVLQLVAMKYVIDVLGDVM